MGVFPHRTQEGFASCRRGSLATENRFEGNHFAVQDGGLVFVLGNRGTTKVDTSENPARPGIGQHFGSHLPVCTGRRITTDRPSRGRGVRSQLELARKQVLHPLVIGDDQDQVNCLSAELQTPAAASNRDRGGSAPAPVRSASRHAFAMLTAEA